MEESISEKKRKSPEEEEVGGRSEDPPDKSQEHQASKTDKKIDDRKQQGNNNNNNNSRKDRRNTKKQRRKQNRAPPKTTSRGEGKSGEIHPGSFAHESLRTLFGVELPLLEEERKEARQKHSEEHGGDAEGNVEASEESMQQNNTAEKTTTTPQSSSENPAALAETKQASEEEEKRIKRKVVFLLAYLGSNFSGFQMNEGQRTLQAEFELALYRAKLIHVLNFGFPFKYSWSTSGRTDKGVHACAQVCSAKIEMRYGQTTTQVLEEVNQQLPDDFRVLDVNRVSKAFCAKTQRDRVSYQYMIPSFLLQDPATLKQLFSFVQHSEHEAAEPLTAEELEKLKPQLHNYRVTPQQMESLKEALKAYEGTHSFHNYSKRVKNDEARSSRYILSFNVEEPIVFESNGTEWIPTQVLGQSFLLHQIRKMIAMAVDVARGAAPLATLQRALSRDEDIRIAPAPAQGLYLEMSFYGGYNRRKNTDPQSELPDLDWTKEDSDVHRRWKEFRNGTLMKHVVEEEFQQSNFVQYLYRAEFVNDYRLYYKLDEAPPDSTVETKPEGDHAKEGSEDQDTTAPTETTQMTAS